jgi:hypothetical protein
MAAAQRSYYHNSSADEALVKCRSMVGLHCTWHQAQQPAAAVTGKVEMSHFALHPAYNVHSVANARQRNL